MKICWMQKTKTVNLNLLILSPGALVTSPPPPSYATTHINSILLQLNKPEYGQVKY
jgi:hypothetical protein